MAKRLYQCPGCWSDGLYDPEAADYFECDCGEKLSVVDLRSQTSPGAAERQRLQPASPTLPSAPGEDNEIARSVLDAALTPTKEESE